MEFKRFKKMLQEHVESMLKNQDKLFIVNVDKDILWNLYLDSFPKGTNEIYRERRFHDCACCRHFIKSFGNVVTIENNKIVTIWDFITGESTYQPVIKALSNYVKSNVVKDIFITKESTFGTDSNFEQFEDETVHEWNHFQIILPKKFISNSNLTVDSIMGGLRDIRNVFKRSLEEISKEAIETALDLISQKSLYKGKEWKGVLDQFLTIHNEYHNLLEEEKDNFCWIKSTQVGAVIGKIKNHSIGVLLTDISNGKDLNESVSRYEAIVAPTNYKRPKAIFSKRMVEEAQKTITELGCLDSLERRFATIDDITVNNILFANKDTINRMKGKDIFSELQKDVVTNVKKFDKVEEVPIETFIKDILPKVTNIEVLVENKHSFNLMSVIAPKNKDSKSMLKWNNNFSWAYQGNITDSMKENVKKAGGNIDGVLRFSIQWNEKGENRNDFDAHCIEPSGNHIYFGNKRQIHSSSGMLDVDIIVPSDETAVENIIWTDLNKMKEGIYEFYVHCYSYRSGSTGFKAEIEYDGQIYEYDYSKSLRQDEKVQVAKVKFSKKNGIEFIESLSSNMLSKTMWNLSTNQFHPVSVMMFSSNYWDGQIGIGNKHYFFIINECKNEETPNGFFNEFLKEDLLVHKRVFEALGSKMKVEPSDNQLSGLGFSSTKRNSVIVKLDGSFTRVIKLIF
jgi:hypothetical protein